MNCVLCKNDTFKGGDLKFIENNGKTVCAHCIRAMLKIISAPNDKKIFVENDKYSVNNNEILSKMQKFLENDKIMN